MEINAPWSQTVALLDRWRGDANEKGDGKHALFVANTELC